MNTELLQQKQKDYLRTAFLQIVGDKTSKSNADKLIASNWSKVHEWSHSAGETHEHLSNLGLWSRFRDVGHAWS